MKDFEKRKARAAAMKAAANTIVEDISAPKKVDPRPFEPAKEPAMTRTLDAMPLRHFLALDFGSRPDQAAGFASHAKRMGPRTILEWRAAYAEFMATPIK